MNSDCIVNNSEWRTDPDSQLLAAFKSSIQTLGVPPMCIALVDEQGELCLFHRMTEAPRRCIAIAIAKAYSAVRLGGSTHAFHQRLIDNNLSLNDFCDPKLTSLPGGDVVFDASGKIEFGIGVSGGSIEEDILAIAKLTLIVKESIY